MRPRDLQSIAYRETTRRMAARELAAAELELAAELAELKLAIELELAAELAASGDEGG